MSRQLLFRICLMIDELLTSDAVFAGEKRDEGDVRADVSGTTGDEDSGLLRRHLLMLLCGYGGGGRKARCSQGTGCV